MMMNNEILDKELDSALQASNDILICLQSGEWDKVNKLNNIRIKLIRMLSLCQNSDIAWQKFGDKLNKMKGLDQQILDLSSKLRDDVATEIRQNGVRKQGCEHYGYVHHMHK